MTDKDYDIIIVGAGPAGSMAAKSAVDNGADVLMIDKRKELGVPVQCGEALSEEVLADYGIEPDSRWAINRVDAAELVAPSGKSVRVEQRPGAKVGYILDRKVFDRDLAIRAVRAGADISIDTYANGLIQNGERIEGVSYKNQQGEEEVYGDMVIAADGVMSKVAKWAGFDTTLGSEDIESGAQFRMVDIDIDAPQTMKFLFGEEMAPGGYVWIFPKDDDIANVGIGVLPEFAEKSSIEYLRDFVDSKPGLRDGKIVEINTGGVPVCGTIEKSYGDDILIAGDAARMVNPLTGGGINWAMRAGAIAGEVAARAVAENDTSEDNLEEYEERWREVMGDKLEKYLKGKEVLLDLDDDELDDLADTLQDVNFDELSLTQMLKAVAKSNPKLMWKLKDFI